MSVEANITIAVIAVAFVLFALDYFSVDHVAIGIIVSLVVTGVLSPAESVEGFSNRATITVAAMFVLGDALIKTGIIESVGPFISKLLSKGYRRSLLIMGTAVGGISAFVNNTPVVATSIPLISDGARNNNRAASKYLIPLSFGAMFGGTCTLIGTSTNLLVDGIARDNGLDGFSMFLFAPLGLVFFAVGLIYLFFFADQLLPEKSQLEDTEDHDVNDYLTEIKVVERLNEYKEGEESQDQALTLGQIFKLDDENIEIKQVWRDDSITKNPKSCFELESNDVLLVKGNLKHIKKILKNDKLKLSQTFSDRKFPEEETKIVEVVILPNSRLENEQINEVNFLESYESRLLGIRQRGKDRFKDLSEVTLKAGDILLLQTNRTGYQKIYKAERKRQAPFLSLSEIGIEQVKKKELSVVGALITAAVLLASFDLVPIMTGALGAIFILVLSRIISMGQAYQAIDWKVIILLGGALSLGKAMSKSGLSEQIAALISENIAGNFGPMAVIAAIYITTSVFTEIMSNNAAAALLAPIAISVAQSLGLDHVPFLLAVTFAGSASFMTPVGYQTNTMVYSAGSYSFSDFTKIGLPLNIIFWIIATLLIPVFYPFSV